MHRKLNDTFHDKLVKSTPKITRDDLLHKHTFIANYQKAILYSLFEKNQITKQQYDTCLEQMNETSME